jgi:hypothetical protein
MRGGHPVSLTEPEDPRPDLDDRPHHLVAEDAPGRGAAVVELPEVGAAEAAAAESKEDLAAPGHGAREVREAAGPPRFEDHGPVAAGGCRGGGGGEGHEERRIAAPCEGEIE